MTDDRDLLADLVLARGTLDRSSHLRDDADWLDRAWAAESSLVLPVSQGKAVVRRGDDGAAALVLATPRDLPDGVERILLGCDDSGTAYFCARVEPDALGDGAADLRDIGSGLDDRDAGLMVAAVALDNWHATHPRCSRCGELTEPAAAGWMRRCPADGREHYPRTDPAVIALIRDPDDRALLGRQARWPQGWYSTLAGFVEPGESAEAAVVREIYEEAGVRVGGVAYLGSQPWPFPCSLMLGYHGWAQDTETNPDGTEIAEVRWFARDELAAACESGEVRLPPDVSIARRLVERWYGRALPGDWSRPLAGRPR